jgi:hypothetical protein
MRTVTVVVAFCELLLVFGSAVSLVTEAVFEMIVPLAVAALTLTTMVNTCGPAAEVSVALVNVIAPVPPGDGVVGVHPAGAEAETNVVFVGVESETETFTASFGPALATVTV